MFTHPRAKVLGLVAIEPLTYSARTRHLHVLELHSVSASRFGRCCEAWSLHFPLTAAIVGVTVAPMISAIGAVAALAGDYAIEVERSTEAKQAAKQASQPARAKRIPEAASRPAKAAPRARARAAAAITRPTAVKPRAAAAPRRTTRPAHQADAA